MLELDPLFLPTAHARDPLQLLIILDPLHRRPSSDPMFDEVGWYISRVPAVDAELLEDAIYDGFRFDVSIEADNEQQLGPGERLFLIHEIVRHASCRISPY